MKDEKNNVIRLTYVEKGIIYHGGIDRKEFLNQMEHMVNWFPGCNDNALELCRLLPNIDSITINRDIIDTQTIPSFTYQNIGSTDLHFMKFRRIYTIVWDFFLHQCEEAKKNN